MSDAQSQENLTPPTLLMAVAAQVQSGDVGDGSQAAERYSQAFRKMLYDCFGEEAATNATGQEIAQQPLQDPEAVVSTIVGLAVGYAKTQADEGTLSEEAFMEIVKVGMYMALKFNRYLEATGEPS